MRSQRIILTKRPVGMPTKDHFSVEVFELPSVQDGQVLVQSLYISVDPYMRKRMSDQKSYVEPTPTHK